VKIAKAALEVTAPSRTINQGEGIPSDAAWALSYAGFVAGEGPSDLSGAGTIGVPGYAGAAGTYAVKAGGLASGNYAISYVDGTLTVTAATTVPGAPTNVVATSAEAGAVLDFGPPENDGGSPVLFYTIRSESGAVITTTTALYSYIGGLVNGVEYVFSVAATNENGEGPQAWSNKVIPKNQNPGGDDKMRFTDGIRQFMRYDQQKLLSVTTDVASYEFVSSNISIATVSSEGLVTPKRPGNLRITVYATDGSGLNATVVLSVNR
jgi:hypothetical protein